MFKKVFIEKIMQGKKTMTSRSEPRYKAGEVTNLMANKDYSKISGKSIKITAVYPKTLGTFTDNEAKKEGFENLAEFKAYWEKNRKKLGEWTPNKEVWVHEFELVTKDGYNPHPPPKFGSLNFKDVIKKEDLQTLASILDDMDLPEAIKRKREVKDAIDFCWKLEERAEDRYSFRFLNESLRAYIYGLNEAAIFYASISVEVLLLSRAFKEKSTVLDDKLTFSKLISSCKHLKVLDEEHSRVANDLRVLRDCYIHYDNLLNYDRYTALRSIEFVKNYQVGDVTEAKKAEAVQVMLNAYNLILVPVFPVVKELSPDRKEFLKVREKKHARWVKSQGINEVEIALNSNTKDGIREMRRYSQEKLDAMDAIMWSFSILKFLFE
jgi:hypothetical protein